MIGENLNTIGKSRKPEEEKTIRNKSKYLKRNGREQKSSVKIPNAFFKIELY